MTYRPTSETNIFVILVTAHPPQFRASSTTEQGDTTMKKVLVLAAFAFFAFALAAGPEVAMTVHPVPVVACSGDDC
jgi:hypothetical protein